MRKILLGCLLLLSAVSCSAGNAFLEFALYWQVMTDTPYANESTYAILYGYDGTSGNVMLDDTRYYGSETDGFIAAGAGTGIFEDGYVALADDGDYKDVLEAFHMLTPENAYFYIELYNENGQTAYSESVSWAEMIGTYDAIEYISDNTMDPGASALNSWRPTIYYPVPEPTSGLLVLLGIAGLALRRKRA